MKHLILFIGLFIGTKNYAQQCDSVFLLLDRNHLDSVIISQGDKIYFQGILHWEGDFFAIQEKYEAEIGLCINTSTHYQFCIFHRVKKYIPIRDSAILTIYSEPKAYREPKCYDIDIHFPDDKYVIILAWNAIYYSSCYIPSRRFWVDEGKMSFNRVLDLKE